MRSLAACSKNTGMKLCYAKALVRPAQARGRQLLLGRGMLTRSSTIAEQGTPTTAPAIFVVGAPARPAANPPANTTLFRPASLLTFSALRFFDARPCNKRRGHIPRIRINRSVGRWPSVQHCIESKRAATNRKKQRRQGKSAYALISIPCVAHPHLISGRHVSSPVTLPAGSG